MFAATMTFENLEPAFWQYRFAYWIEVLLAVTLMGLVVGVLVSFLRHRHPVQAIASTVKSLIEGIKDIITLPLGARRIYAIAVLSFKEAIRRKVLYVFILFLIPFLFAGWYLPNQEEGQLLFLVAFVNTAMTWLLLPMVLFIVAMNLPNDLKNRTIQTIVTKPVRRLELVLGRVLGFMGIFTLVLAVMGGVSLIYLWRQITPEVYNKQWVARVPVYAQPPAEAEAVAVDGGSYPLMFFKDGQLLPSGTNVGKEYSYRSHVEGATGDEGRFYFNFEPSLFAGTENARLQLTLDIFKTTKGDPARDVGEAAEKSGIYCNLRVSDRKSDKSYTQIFRVDHHRTHEVLIPTNILDSGQVLVSIACVNVNQFLGMGPSDVYFLANEQSFAVNFFKGLVSTWLKVLLLTTICVSASTVLNGFVTILLAAMVYILGINYQFLRGVISGNVEGGGPIESAIRLITQANQVTDLDPTPFHRFALRVDQFVLWIMDKLSNVIPNLSTLDTAEFVAKGFDIPGSLLIQNIIVILGYVVPVLIAGYFLLKSREIAA